MALHNLSGNLTNQTSATYLEGPGPGGANFGHPNGFKQPGPLTVVPGMPSGLGYAGCYRSYLTQVVGVDGDKSA